MKMFHNYKLLMALPLVFIFNACSKGIHENPKNAGINASSAKIQPSSELHIYGQVNLVADVSGYYSEAIDKNLVNAWGVAFGPSGGIWVSANHTGLSTIYDIHGSVLRPPVTIPSSNNKGPGSPTGMVYNTTSDFIIPGNHEKGKFIFASEDGIIVAWSSGNSAIKVADRSAHHSVYKGLTLANNGEGNFLYATDFSNGKIDIYDRHFRFVGHNEFLDPTIPIGYAPFNIQYLGGEFYVTYAKQKPDHHDDQSGPGNGYVNVFTPKGKLIKRFASRGILNSPWGIARSEQSFCENESKIFVGNFGDGKINVFDVSGEYNGPLLKHDKELNAVPIVIDGLWDLSFQPEYVHGRDINALFFTAGPNHEQHGLFGYIHCIQPY